ncbi:hypothetical protein GW17_00050047 [Ensete ventricosum]|nr:hypothetical protein GW17_00050047 [Ensete ventricosum]
MTPGVASGCGLTRSTLSRRLPRCTTLPPSSFAGPAPPPTSPAPPLLSPRHPRITSSSSVVAALLSLLAASQLLWSLAASQP